MNIPAGYVVEQISDNAWKVESPDGKFRQQWRTEGECVDAAIDHARDGTIVSVFDLVPSIPSVQDMRCDCGDLLDDYGDCISSDINLCKPIPASWRAAIRRDQEWEEESNGCLDQEDSQAD